MADQAVSANLGGLLLLLDVLAEQGRDVMVVPRSAWSTADLTDVDYIVVEDDTWREWQHTIGYP
jgi:hypothetical protein